MAKRDGGLSMCNPFTKTERRNIVKALSLKTVNIKMSRIDFFFCIFYQLIQWVVFSVPIIINLVMHNNLNLRFILDILTFTASYSFIPFIICAAISFLAEVDCTLYLYRLFCYSSIYNIGVFVMIYFFYYYNLVLFIYMGITMTFISCILVIITTSRNIICGLKSMKKNVRHVPIIASIMFFLQYVFLFQIIP